MNLQAFTFGFILLFYFCFYPFCFDFVPSSYFTFVLPSMFLPSMFLPSMFLLSIFYLLFFFCFYLLFFFCFYLLILFFILSFLTLLLVFAFFLEVKRNRVDAVALSGWFRPVFENMPQVAPAA